MTATLLILSLTCAGFVVAFTQLREDTGLYRLVRRIPYPFSHAIACPFCLCYWTALLACILIDPFPDWFIPWRATLGFTWTEPLVRILAGWFAVGLLANAWRVLYMLVGKDMALAAVKAEQVREELK